MSFTEQDLDNLSKLARITITDDEKPRMLQNIQAILGYVSEINSVDGALDRENENVFNVVREDIVTNAPGTNTQAILREAPDSLDSYVKVKQVLK